MSRTGGMVRGHSGGLAGERIRVRRKEQGLSQIDLAEASDVSRQTIVSMETGDYSPSVYLALKVARILECQVEDLWG
jgi:putative transcriptional regulator